MIIPGPGPLREEYEEWRGVRLDHEIVDEYEVSSLGRVKRAVGGRGTRAGKILKGLPDSHGYPTVGLSIQGERIPAKVHQLVLYAFVGPRPSPEHGGAHLDGNKLNNRESNLLWKIQKENIKDKIAHGTHGVKLNEEKVAEILLLRKAGKTLQAIANMFSITKGTTGKIVNGDLWKHCHANT